MTRLVIYSDMHWGDAGLAECEAAADDLADLVAAVDPDVVLNLGDTFHAKDAVSSRTLDAFATKMQRVRAKSHLVLSGNHDASDRAGEVTSARVLSLLGADVVTGSKIITVGDTAIGLLSHTSDAQALNEHARTLARDLRGVGYAVFSHVPIRGAAFNAKSVEESPDALDRSVLGDGIKLLFSGHYHHPQVLPGVPEVVICGSPSYLTWGDNVWFEAGSAVPRGFLVVEIERTGATYRRVAAQRTTVRLSVPVRQLNPVNPMGSVQSLVDNVRRVHPNNPLVVRLASESDERKHVEAVLERLQAEAETCTPGVTYTATTSGRLTLPGTQQIRVASVEAKPLLRSVVAGLDRTIEERAAILTRAESFLPAEGGV